MLNFSNRCCAMEYLNGGRETQSVFPPILQTATRSMKSLPNWIITRLAAAIAFYTCIPIPSSWSLEFQTVSRLAPLIGVLTGGILAGLDLLLAYGGMPDLTRSGLIVISWIGLTGGLHLDGAMDTADGLAVTDPNRRLQVMADSATGAFGAMVAIALVLLKTTALYELPALHGFGLIMAAGWGRWSQQVAIARYPYLKPTGKGAFHKTAIQTFWDTLPSLILLIGLSTLPLLWYPQQGLMILSLMGMGGAIAFLVPAWFNHKLGGHTGDTYGAVVEWTEALFLISFTTVYVF